MILETKRYHLTDIADIQRAGKRKVYPKGTIYIQVSATKGQIGMLHNESPIETKYVTVIPKIDIYSPYLKLAIERSMPRFLARYRSTINIQIDDFEFFEIDIHEDRLTQLEVVAVMKQCDKAREAERKIIEQLKTVKRIALSKMMC